MPARFSRTRRSINPSGFCINLFDDARHEPEIKGTKFEVPAAHIICAGWIWRDGKINNVLKGWKRVERDLYTLRPHVIEFEVQDDSGRATFFRGTRLGSCPWPVWPTMYHTVNMFRWECEGKVTHGEAQEPFWSDYPQHFSPQAQLRRSGVQRERWNGV
jgi:hypothetical protein